MQSMLFTIGRQIAAGKTPLRALMNIALSEHTLTPGVVVDLGGGNNPSYLGYLKGVSEVTFKNIDIQYGEGEARAIDFETDTLPYEDNSIDQILMLNVLEHIYNHVFFAQQACRILKPGRTVIGFVPFLINYHADPHDYFRYTHEALERIFQTAGFSQVDIRPLGGGPFMLNFNTLASFVPRHPLLLVWPFYYALDKLVLAIRPALRKRFPLGYLFILTK